MLNGRVNILFLDFLEDADIVTGSFFFSIIKIAVLYRDCELTGLQLEGLAWLSWSFNGLVSQKHPSLVQSTDHQVFTFL